MSREKALSFGSRTSGRPRVAIVQDTLPFIGGAERTLMAILEIFPDAPLYTLIYNRKAFAGTIFAERQIYTSFLDRLPGVKQRHRSLIPLYPFAIERFDLRGYDIILSCSYAVAHGVLPRPEQLHINYMYTPLRYAWHYYHPFLNDNGLNRGLKSWPVKVLLHYLRLWDWAASDRVDTYAAISDCVARRIWRSYRRKATVIYPPVEVERFGPLGPREDYYVVLSRLEGHKRVALVVEAFGRLGLPLLVVGEGREHERLARLAAPNVKLLGWQPDRNVRELLGRARALVHGAEEDFGIALVEAQAAGCPVIAYGGGGALETVIPGRTGVLFSEQSVESLVDAVEAFEREKCSFDAAALRANAARFNKERFQRELGRLVCDEWQGFEAGIVSES